MKKNSIVFILIVIFCLSGISFAEETIKIGVLAKRGAVKAMSKWKLTGEFLTKSLPGKKFEIIPLGFNKVYPAIEGNDIDFFLVNSSMFITAKVKFGAKAIVTMINSRQGKPLTSFGGVILTLAENDTINTLSDLKGKTFMAVKASSFGGWQMAYKELLDAGINPYRDFSKLEFGNKHDNVILAVQNETVDAGTVRTDTLERMASAEMIDLDEFKIIHQKKYSDFPFKCSTSLYPEWPLAKTVQTSDQLAEQVAAALKGLKAEHPAAKTAKIVGWMDPLDYTPVESLQQLLNIGAYEN